MSMILSNNMVHSFHLVLFDFQGSLQQWVAFISVGSLAIRGTVEEFGSLEAPGAFILRDSLIDAGAFSRDGSLN